jgi:hypothetical protein
MLARAPFNETIRVDDVAANSVRAWVCACECVCVCIQCMRVVRSCVTVICEHTALTTPSPRYL